MISLFEGSFCSKTKWLLIATGFELYFCSVLVDHATRALFVASFWQLSIVMMISFSIVLCLSFVSVSLFECWFVCVKNTKKLCKFLHISAQSYQNNMETYAMPNTKGFQMKQIPRNIRLLRLTWRHITIINILMIILWI